MQQPLNHQIQPNKPDLFVSRGNRLGGSFHLIPVTLLCVYYHIRVHMYIYIYVKYITCTHRRSQLDPQTFLFRNLVHSLKNFLQNFLVFSKMDAGTEKQLSQNEAFQKWLTSLGAHLFSFGAKGKSTIPFNRHPTYQIDTSEFAPKGCPNRC